VVVQPFIEIYIHRRIEKILMGKMAKLRRRKLEEKPEIIKEI